MAQPVGASTADVDIAFPNAGTVALVWFLTTLVQHSLWYNKITGMEILLLTRDAATKAYVDSTVILQRLIA